MSAVIGSAAERRRLLDGRICYVCRRPVPERMGMYHVHLGILTHHRAGPCSATVLALERVYDRSRRGRWRPWRELLRHLDALREGADA